MGIVLPFANGGVFRYGVLRPAITIYVVVLIVDYYYFKLLMCCTVRVRFCRVTDCVLRFIFGIVSH